MTGHRRPKGKPLGAIATAQRRHAHYHALLTHADPKRRLAAAADYLRAALTGAPQDLVTDIAHRMTTTLVTEAHRVQSATVAAAQERQQAGRRRGQ